MFTAMVGGYTPHFMLFPRLEKRAELAKNEKINIKDSMLEI